MSKNFEFNANFQENISVSPMRLLRERQAAGDPEYTEANFLHLPVHVIRGRYPDPTRTTWAFTLVQRASGKIAGILSPSAPITSDNDLYAGRGYPRMKTQGWLLTTTIVMRASELVFNAITSEATRETLPYREFLTESARTYLLHCESRDELSDSLAELADRIGERNKKMKIGVWRLNALDEFFRVLTKIDNVAKQAAAELAASIRRAENTARLEKLLEQKALPFFEPSADEEPEIPDDDDPPARPLGAVEKVLADLHAKEPAGTTGEPDKDEAPARVQYPSILPLPVYSLPYVWGSKTLAFALVRRKPRGRLLGILGAEMQVDSNRVLTIAGRAFPASNGKGTSAGWVYKTDIQVPLSSVKRFDAAAAAEGVPLSYRRALATFVRQHLASLDDGSSAVPALIRRDNAELILNLSRYRSRGYTNRIIGVLAASPDIDDNVISSTLWLDVIKPFVVPAPSSRNILDKKSDSNAELLEKLSKGITRPLLPAPSPAVLKPLYEAFPNFSAALDLVASNLALCARAGVPMPLKLPAILLAGEPGIGKSAFVVSLAKVLGFNAYPREVDFAVASAGWILGGLSSTWDGAKHGLVLDSFLDPDSYANGVIIGNEIDKASTDARFDPLGPLLTLLEPETAARFHDEFVPSAVIDASFLNWFLTCNDVENVSEPLLSRVQVVAVPAPTHEQKIGIAARMYEDARARQAWGNSFPADLDSEVLELLARAGNPRELKRALQKALGNAARAGAPCVLVEHVEIGPAQRRSIGF